MQQNAKQVGMEISFLIKFANRIDMKSNYASMISKTADGYYTPFLPANKWVTELKSILFNHDNLNIDSFLEFEYNEKQLKIAPNEIYTPDYYLINAGLSIQFLKLRRNQAVQIKGNNLTNQSYYDHLSRFKYFNLLNMGRNIEINYKITF